ncbi:hypothetical protein [Sagittula sp. NFXS13]|uniref:hypothetical protein n=1 Tax=Sagittula sp. NFXS13 TaxID=2819095 RepID=UPI0032DE70F6
MEFTIGDGMAAPAKRQQRIFKDICEGSDEPDGHVNIGRLKDVEHLAPLERMVENEIESRALKMCLVG